MKSETILYGLRYFFGGINEPGVRKFVRTTNYVSPAVQKERGQKAIAKAEAKRLRRNKVRLKNQTAQFMSTKF